MSPQAAPRRTLEDIERLERVPLARRLAVGSTYALLQKALASSPEQPARCFLPLGGPSPPGEALTARAFLRKVHQTANLLADLGMGPQDAMALLLPDLLEKEVLLWGGQAAGIVCPIPPWLPALQIVDLMQAAKAEDYPADRLHTGREITADDLAVCFPTKDTTGIPDLLPLTHGNLLYIVVSPVSRFGEQTWRRSFASPLSLRLSWRSFRIPGS